MCHCGLITPVGHEYSPPLEGWQLGDSETDGVAKRTLTVTRFQKRVTVDTTHCPLQPPKSLTGGLFAPFPSGEGLGLGLCFFRRQRYARLRL